jgi:hypothetical protein
MTVTVSMKFIVRPAAPPFCAQHLSSACGHDLKASFKVKSSDGPAKPRKAAAAGAILCLLASGNSCDSHASVARRPTLFGSGCKRRPRDLGGEMVQTRWPATVLALRSVISSSLQALCRIPQGRYRLAALPRCHHQKATSPRASLRRNQSRQTDRPARAALGGAP